MLKIKLIAKANHNERRTRQSIPEASSTKPSNMMTPVT
jgi:hypothetical protein